MPGLFGYLAAGAAEGAGTSIKDQAIAKREAALRRLEIEGEMAFRRGESAADRAFRAKEGGLNRDVTREGQRKLVTTDDGRSGLLGGDGSFTPGKDETGAPVNFVQDASEAPAEVKIAEYVLKHGIAKTREEAFAMATRAKDNPTQRAKLVVDTFKVMKDDLMDDRPDAEKRAAAQSFVNELLGQEDGSESTAKPGGSAMPAGSGTKDDPFKAATQSDIEWFKKSAQPGDVIVIDGKAYTK